MIRSRASIILACRKAVYLSTARALGNGFDGQRYLPKMMGDALFIAGGHIQDLWGWRFNTSVGLWGLAMRGV